MQHILQFPEVFISNCYVINQVVGGQLLFRIKAIY